MAQRDTLENVKLKHYKKEQLWCLKRLAKLTKMIEKMEGGGSGEGKSQEPVKAEENIVDLTPFIPDELLGTGIRGDPFSPIEENPLKEDK